MGITLGEIIEEIGGGIESGKHLKAVQTGGPSGGCIPAEHAGSERGLRVPRKGRFHRWLGRDDRSRRGRLHGEHGEIFYPVPQAESCGKCVPCRVGTKRLLETLERITSGHGRSNDLERLEKLSAGIKTTALCGLGQTAPNPILSSIKYFREEFETHIRDKKCPAKVCKNLLTYTINQEMCKACGTCLRACPSGAITGAKKVPHKIDR